MKCPGQDTQYWDNNAIFETECPECGHTLEFFKDDATRLCKNCRKKIVNPKMDFGCASYCKFAEQCLGSLPEEFTGIRDDLLKDRVAVEVKRHLKKDFRRIGHAVRMAGFAEKIGKKEKARLPVVLCAAYLYNIMDDNADGKKAPEKKDSGIIRAIMEKLGAREELIQELIDTLSFGPSLKKEDSLEKKILHDADVLARLDGFSKMGGLGKMDGCDKMTDCNKNENTDKRSICAKSGLLTLSGKELAKQIVV